MRAFQHCLQTSRQRKGLSQTFLPLWWERRLKLFWNRNTFPSRTRRHFSATRSRVLRALIPKRATDSESIPWLANVYPLRHLAKILLSFRHVVYIRKPRWHSAKLDRCRCQRNAHDVCSSHNESVWQLDVRVLFRSVVHDSEHSREACSVWPDHWGRRRKSLRERDFHSSFGGRSASTVRRCRSSSSCWRRSVWKRNTEASHDRRWPLWECDASINRINPGRTRVWGPISIHHGAGCRRSFCGGGQVSVPFGCSDSRETHVLSTVFHAGRSAAHVGRAQRLRQCCGRSATIALCHSGATATGSGQTSLRKRCFCNDGRRITIRKRCYDRGLRCSLTFRYHKPGSSTRGQLVRRPV